MKAMSMRRLIFCHSAFVLPLVLLGGMVMYPSTSRAQTPADASQTGAQAAVAAQTSDLQKVADRWDDAIDQHDQYALELVLAPQFIGISDDGEVRDRDQVVSQMVMKGAVRYTLAQKVTSVREIGDVAVVNGTYDRVYQGSKLSHTRLKDQKGVFSQVYVRARNTWQCINSQRTLITLPSAAADRKKTGSRSKDKTLGHDLNFHFPGRHHSGDSQPQ